MKTITEYLVNNHVTNNEEIHSPYDLSEGDYFKAEWTYNNQNYWTIAKFSRIDYFTNMNIYKSVIYDFCISKVAINTEIKVSINGYLGRVDDKSVTYKNPTKHEIDLLNEVEQHIKTHNLEKYIGRIDIHTIGYYNNNKFEWKNI